MSASHFVLLDVGHWCEKAWRAVKADRADNERDDASNSRDQTPPAAIAPAVTYVPGSDEPVSSVQAVLLHAPTLSCDLWNCGVCDVFTCQQPTCASMTYACQVSSTTAGNCCCHSSMSLQAT